MSEKRKPKVRARELYHVAPDVVDANAPLTNLLEAGMVKEARAELPGPVKIGYSEEATTVELAINRSARWFIFANLVEGLVEDPALGSDEDIGEFARYVAALCRDHGMHWGADGVLAAISHGFAKRAAGVAKAKGEETRRMVKACWSRLTRAGIPVRGRVKRIASDCAVSETQVREALRELGLYDPKRGIRG